MWTEIIAVYPSHELDDVITFHPRYKTNRKQNWIVGQIKFSASITVWYGYTFRPHFILFRSGAQLSSQKAAINGGDNRDAMSVDHYLTLCTHP